MLNSPHCINENGKSGSPLSSSLGAGTLCPPDGDETGYWSKDDNNWVHLGGKYSDEIDSALKIAYKQAPPDFINLPVQGVEK